MNLRTPKRRTVLKGLGAGVAGGTVLTGTASASCPGSYDVEVDIDDVDLPDLHIDLGTDETKHIRYTNNHDEDHNITHHAEDNLNKNTRSAALLPTGEKYHIKLTDNDGNSVTVAETDCEGHAGDDLQDFTVEYDSDGSLTIHYHCDFHNAGHVTDNMAAHIHITSV